MTEGREAGENNLGQKLKVSDDELKGAFTESREVRRRKYCTCSQWPRSARAHAGQLFLSFWLCKRNDEADTVAH